MHQGDGSHISAADDLGLERCAVGAHIVAAWAATLMATMALLLLDAALWQLAQHDTEKLPIFLNLLVRDWRGAIATIAILLLPTPLVFATARIPVDRVRLPKYWLAASLVLYTVLLLMGTHIVYHTYPIAADEYSPLFQARLFAKGELVGHFPPELLHRLIPPVIGQTFYTTSITGAVVSSYWPGFALLLTPFVVFGVPWVLNPLISAAALYGIYQLARACYSDPRVASLAVLLAMVSPAFWAQGISYYSMQAHLAANVWFLWLLTKRPTGASVAAGMIGGLALTLNNPVPHLLFALPVWGWLAVRRERRRQILVLAASYLPAVLVLGLGWYMVRRGVAADSGSGPGTTSFLTGVMALLGSAFHPPTPWSFAVRGAHFLKIVAWSAPGLVFLALRGAPRRPSGLMRPAGWSAVLIFAAYLFVPFDQGHGWSSRYFHPVWFILPILAASYIIDNITSFARSATYGVIVLFLTATAGAAVWADSISDFISDTKAESPEIPGVTPQLVFIAADSIYYGVDLVQNRPDCSGGVLRLVSHGAGADSILARSVSRAARVLRIEASGSAWLVARNRFEVLCSLTLQRNSAEESTVPAAF